MDPIARASPRHTPPPVLPLGPESTRRTALLSAVSSDKSEARCPSRLPHPHRAESPETWGQKRGRLLDLDVATAVFIGELHQEGPRLRLVLVTRFTGEETDTVDLHAPVTVPQLHLPKD